MFIAICLFTVQAPDTTILRLRDALARARDANPALLAVRADAREAGGVALGGTRAFLPSVALNLQGVRSTDPVAAFGMKLRQEQFGANDLTLDALNRPSPYGGFTTALQVEWPLLAPEGLFAYRAAGHAADAQAAGARRAAGATTFLVTRAYWDAQLANTRLHALGTARRAADAHTRQAEALYQQGVVTGLDARLARLAAANVAAQETAALAAAANARATLLALLDLPDDPTLILGDPLDSDDTATCDPTCDVTRADLDAMEAGVAAAVAGVRAARAAHLPQIAVFGNLGHHSRALPWEHGSGDWTVGIAVQWNLLPAMSGVGAIRASAARQDAADARLTEATRRAEVELAGTHRLAAAAATVVTIAEAAAQEAGEALDQATLRYRTGVSPVTELLDVQAATTNATLGLAQARYGLLVARAALDFAYGVHDQ